MASIEILSEQITKLQGDVKNLLKLMRRVLKVQEDPDGSKAKKRNENNGFNELVPITKDLAKFLQIEGSEPMSSRADVTKKVNAYINEKDLKDPSNRRRIMVEKDKSLMKLFQPEAGKDVTFLNIQSHLAKHYIKILPK